MKTVAEQRFSDNSELLVAKFGRIGHSSALRSGRDLPGARPSVTYESNERKRGKSRGNSEVYKDHAGQVVETGWAEMDYHAAAAGRPWRTFPWYLGQRNYSGRYWSATERALVGYESLLELSRLILADFDREVKRIASQPFHLVIRKSGTQRRRTPDYLLVRDGGPVVVDVMSSKELANEDVIRLLELTREVVQSRGWDYEIACEPEKVFFANVRFLAGYRRDWLFAPDVLAEIRSAAAREPQQRICDVIDSISRPKAIALAGIMHLLWRLTLHADVVKRGGQTNFGLRKPVLSHSTSGGGDRLTSQSTVSPEATGGTRVAPVTA